MKKLSLLLLLSSLLITGCGGKKANPTSEISSSEEEEIKDEDYQDINVEMDALLNNKVSSYSLTVPYQKRYFNESTTAFNKSLALLSFGVAISANKKNKISDLYSRLSFDNVFLAEDYDNEPTEDTVAFAIGHREIDDCHLIGVALRGENYEREWANNFDIGSEGNHYGFNRAADIVKEAVVNYVTDNYKNENLKFWITGYSRGAAIANMLSDKLMSEKEIDINEDNAYVYTFEAPRGFNKEAAHNYKNIINATNTADIVTYLAPEEYGLYRSGVDVDIYSDKIDDWMKSFDSGIIFPPLLSKSGRFRNDVEHAKYLIRSLIKEGDNDKYIPTRKDYVDKYQPAVKYLFGLFFSMDVKTLQSIIQAFKDLPNSEKFDLTKGDNLYNFLKEQLLKNDFDFDETELRSVFDSVKGLIDGPLQPMIDEVVSGSNISRLIYMHTPETIYTLLKNYKK